MPVPGNQAHTLPVRARHLTAQGQAEHDDHEDYSAAHVQGMQANERVIGCPEEITADGQLMAVDQLMPLVGGAAKEYRTEHDGCQPPLNESPLVAAPQRPLRQ